MNKSSRVISLLTTVAMIALAHPGGSAHAQIFVEPWNYFPSSDVTDAKMVAQAGVNLETLVNVGTNFEIEVIEPGDWELGVFDGDTNKTDGSGVKHWDLLKSGSNTQLIYRLFADPVGDSSCSGCVLLYEWPGNAALPAYPGVSYTETSMPDNAWIDITVPESSDAETGFGSWRYRLNVALENSSTAVESSFKLRATGRIRTVANQPFQLIGAYRNTGDYYVVYPEGTIAPTTYNGEFRLYLEVPAGADRLDIWDGDFDHGAGDGSSQDLDDPDSPAIPPFSYSDNPAVEGAKGKGVPADNSNNAWSRRSPSVEYTLTAPNGDYWVNDNPSGNTEWEKFTVATAACDCELDADYIADELPAGIYEIAVNGLDLNNIAAFLMDVPAYSVVLEGDANLGNQVWFDQFPDGILGSGEIGIQGVSVTAYRDVNLSGTVDPGEPEVGTDVTDASGHYLIEGLGDGQYIVVIDDSNFANGGALSTYYQTTTAVSQVDDNTNKVDPYVTFIANQEDNLTADFGYDKFVGGAGDGSIGDLVWLDLDDDGTFDSGVESGIEGVDVILYLDTDDDGIGDIELATTTTDSNGRYLFSGLADGDYVVVVDTDSAALDDLDPSPHTFGGTLSPLVEQNRGTSYSTTITGGNSDETADFAFYAPGSIGDLVWYDINRDGIQDDGEPGEAGIEVELWLDTDNDGIYEEGTDELLATDTTDSNGEYLFTGLGAGNYFVVIQSGEGPSDSLYGDKTVSPPYRGGDDTADSDGFLISGGDIVSGQIQLAAGESDLSVDFGFYLGDTLCVSWPSDPDDVGAYTTYYIDTVAGTATVRTTLWPTFADTAYGTGSKDPLLDGGPWPQGHGRRFDQIVGSDNLQMKLFNGDDSLRMDFTMDLLAEDGSGGYETAGIDPTPQKSDGSCATGCSYVVSVETSPSMNYNELGWTNTTTSPDPTDQPGIYNDPEQWIKLAWYEATVDLDAFGSSGFGTVLVTALHSSPPKTGPDNPTVGPCPSGWEDDYEDFQDQYGGSYGLAPAGGDQPAPRLVVSCSTCGGNVTMLTMKYIGNGKKDVIAQQKVGSGYYQVYQGSLKPGETFAFNGADASGTFGSELRLYVNGKLDATIRTDCTQNIGPGLVSGSFEVVEGYSLNGGLLCPVNP